MMHPFVRLSAQAFTDRRFLAANAVAVASLVFLVYFPKNGVAELLLLAFFCYLVFPIIFIRALLHEPLSQYGFSWGYRRTIYNAGLVFVAMGIFLAFLWGLFLMGNDYSPLISDIIRADYRTFLLYVAFSTVSNALSCFFFQGFLLSVWKKYYGWRSILWVTIFFLAFLLVKNNFIPSTLIFPLVFWSFLVSGVSFVSGSVFVAFCFLFFSDILLTLFLVLFR